MPLRRPSWNQIVSAASDAHDGDQQGSKETEAACARQRPRGQQHRQRRNRQPDLLREHPSQQNDVAVTQQEFERAMHGLGLGAWVPRLAGDWGEAPIGLPEYRTSLPGNETSSMPPAARHDKFGQGFAACAGRVRAREACREAIADRRGTRWLVRRPASQSRGNGEDFTGLVGIEASHLVNQ